MTRLPARKKACGFSLIEASLVVMITGAVAGAVWFALSQVNDSAKDIALVQQSTLTAQNMRQYYNSLPLPTGVANETDLTLFTPRLAAREVFPTDMCNQTCIDNARSGTGSVNVLNAYGGTVTAAIVSATPYNLYYLTFNGLPQHACIKYVTDITRRTASIGLSELLVEATSLTAGNFPVSSDTATSACAASPALSSVRHTLRLRST